MQEVFFEVNVFCVTEWFINSIKRKKIRVQNKMSTMLDTKLSKKEFIIRLRFSNH